MKFTKTEVMQFVAENDVKFIRLAFCDHMGQMKNLSIMPGELQRAFEEGISFDASAIGFREVDRSDLLLKPDPGTLAILPWRPAHGRVVRMYCHIVQPDGEAFAGDGRYLLREVLKDYQDLGLQCQLGAECEFYLFELDEKGRPTLNPHDQAGYLDVAPLDQAENVRREICLTLEEMGIHPESSHHEQGPGQNEVDFKHSDPLTAADDLMTFRWVVKTIAARNGLYATFLPKPLPEVWGSGLHINLSLFKEGRNLFRGFGDKTASSPRHAEISGYFMAGIMDHIEALTLFLNPLVNSYARLGVRSAPKYISWDQQNRSQLIRIPAAGQQQSRMELRSPDPAMNPYLGFYLILQAGLKGILEQRTLPQAQSGNLYLAEEASLIGLKRLPGELGQAIDAAEKSGLIQEVLPQEIYKSYLNEKKHQWQEFLTQGGDYARDRSACLSRF